MVKDMRELGSDTASKTELARLAAALWPVFERDFADLERRLGELDENVATGPPNPAWQLAADLATATDRVAEDVVRFVEGSLARTANVDRGVCSLVDWLLGWLASQAKVGWERVTLPAVRETASERTWIISLRITDATIWSLPVMAHEFGHFAVERLENNANERPGAALLAPEWVSDEAAAATGLDRDEALRFFSTAHRHELFADVFAAFVTGPAYAAALVWRASPHRAWLADGDHPGWGYRVRVVLRALYRQPALAWMADFVRDAWADDLEESGQSAAADEKRLALVDRFADDVLAVLAETVSALEFADSKAVLDAERMLRDDAAPTPVELRALMNAAWAARLRLGWDADVTSVGEDALDRALGVATLGGKPR